MYYKSNNHPKVLPSYCLHIKKLTMIIIINVAHGLYSTNSIFHKNSGGRVGVAASGWRRREQGGAIIDLCGLCQLRA